MWCFKPALKEKTTALRRAAWLRELAHIILSSTHPVISISQDIPFIANYCSEVMKALSMLYICLLKKKFNLMEG